MEIANKALVQELFDRISAKYTVPDPLDLEVVLEYFCAIILKEHEMMATLNQNYLEVLSSMDMSTKDIVIDYYSRAASHTKSFAELEENLLYYASSISNALKRRFLSDAEKVPHDLNTFITQIQLPPWVYFLKDDRELRKTKCGKWMYFFSDKYWARKICLQAVDENVVCEAKYTDGPNGVACFYLNIDDLDRHKKVIQFLLDNDLVKKTKSGLFTNLAFKLDTQTTSKKYGKDFEGLLHLNDFINLETGQFKESVNDLSVFSKKSKKKM